MKLPKKAHYGVMLVLYTNKNKRTTIEKAARDLKLSKHLLEQVARQLRVHGILKSYKGPNGGYEVIGEPEVGTVLNILKSDSLISAFEFRDYVKGTEEQGIFARFIVDMESAWEPLFKKKVTELKSL